MSTIEINPELEPEVQTDKEKTKTLPCRSCGRACVVNLFKDPARTECSACRGKAAPAVKFEFDDELEPQVLTDKEDTKEIPCRECHRRCIVSVFKTPASTICTTCSGKHASSGSKGTVGVPKPGQTDPTKAVNLSDCLINPQFAFARCPVHPDDEDHVMELKSVSHSDQYGPSEMVGIKNGRPEYRQMAQGETVLYQCLKCKATVAYSTTAQTQFRRLNEVRDDRHVNGWASSLGVREEEPVGADK